MPSAEAPPHLAKNPFTDLSGVATDDFPNPYDAHLALTKNNAGELQERYAGHRSQRNKQQKAKLLDPAFSGVIIDPVLERLEDKSIEPGYVDPRHCLVFWGRPPKHIKDLIAKVQDKLRAVAPHLWLMPPEDLHITIMEIAHSKTADEIEILKEQIAPVANQVVNYTLTPNHQARLIKPMIGFDASALAIGFVPAAIDGEGFSYHHLRRDVFQILKDAGINVESRYVVPSAHLTIGRFITQKDFEGQDETFSAAKMKQFIDTIEEINKWLQAEFWKEEDSMESNGSWIVGGESPVVLRWGTVWYGGGETMVQTTHN